ncbi:hypothetical protein Bca52824_020477 [Brassica carinata]|uniref:FANCI solenoid 1 domain-containing protein n=1 Tax=Brassica carinata TaxID=52824 RepID=A0A8X7VV30_BRACI|nr:hypothetical protein Bca52824_020477 [Brassica carinata]
MISLAKELPFLDKGRKTELLEKVFSGVKCIDLQNLPSLVYQLLVLASKGFYKREVIGGVVFFFGSKAESRVAYVLKQIEGTILLHANFAVKQDPSLGQEVVVLRISGLLIILRSRFCFRLLGSESSVRTH